MYVSVRRCYHHLPIVIDTCDKIHFRGQHPQHMIRGIQGVHEQFPMGVYVFSTLLAWISARALKLVCTGRCVCMRACSCAILHATRVRVLVSAWVWSARSLALGPCTAAMPALHLC